MRVHKQQNFFHNPVAKKNLLDPFEKSQRFYLKLLRRKGA